jgi:hypothetical protein
MNKAPSGKEKEYQVVWGGHSCPPAFDLGIDLAVDLDLGVDLDLDLGVDLDLDLGVDLIFKIKDRNQHQDRKQN